MSIDVDIQFAATGSRLPSAESLSLWARAALSGQQQAELSIRIVDSEESQQLNRDYRGKDKPTNVLSFPAELPDTIDIPLLGDLVICASVVNREAAEQAKTEDAHWAHMVIHGCLHLLGYDHIDNGEAEVMEALEIKILAGLGFADPYAETQTEASNKKEPPQAA